MGQRKKGRVNSAYIAIKYHYEEDWLWSKAENWSEDGFYFLADEDFDLGEEVEFKKALNVFTGEVRWRKDEPSLETIFHMAVNRIISQEGNRAGLAEDSLIEALRGEDLREKLRFAKERLNLNLTKEGLKSLIQEQDWQKAHCYGVLCQDPIWRELVEEVKEQSGAMTALEEAQERWARLLS